RLRAGLNLDGVPNPARKASLRLDASVLYKAGFVFGFDDRVSFGERLFYVTPNNAATHQNVFFPIRVYARCTRSQRIVDGHQRRQLLPRNWKTREVEPLNHVSITNDRGHCFSSKARF